MSIRPVDYQIVVNKTGDMSKDANLVRSRSDIQQFQFSEELQRKKIQDEKKVISTAKTEHRRVDNRKQGTKKQSKGQDHSRGNGKKMGETQEREEGLISGQGSNIDIKI